LVHNKLQAKDISISLSFAERMTNEEAHNISYALKQMTSLKRLTIAFDSWFSSSNNQPY